MTERATRQLRVRTVAEHTSIEECLGGFEAALTGAEGKAPFTWQMLVRRELGPLVSAIAEHTASAESDQGLLRHMEVRLGRNRSVSNARRLHTTVARQAADLLGVLGQASSGDDIRLRGARLAAAVRRHQSLEVDLLLLAMHGECGVGD
jgi:hypothetical protein